MAPSSRHAFITVFISFWLLFIPAFPSLHAEEVWTDIGLFGGYIYHVDIDPVNPDKMFAAAYMGDGLYVTHDGGGAWQAVTAAEQVPGEDTFKNHAVFDVKIAPSDRNIVWAAHNYWVELSTDGGNTWSHVLNSRMQRDCTGCGGNGDNFRYCFTIEIDPNDAGHVYVGAGAPYLGTGGTLYETKDRGVTWRKLNQGTGFDYPVWDIAIDSQNPAILWLVTNSIYTGIKNGGLYRSADGGDTWENVTAGASFGQMWAVAPVPGNPDIVFSASDTGIITHEFNGTSWGSAHPVPESITARDIVIPTKPPSRIYAVWRNPLSDGSGPASISISKNGGGSWETVRIDRDVAIELNGIAVHPGLPSRLFASDSSLGIIGSDDDGKNWVPFNQGINSLIVYDVETNPNNRQHIIAGTISGLFERKNGQPWRLLSSSGNIHAVAFDPIDSDTLYAGAWTYLFKTTDGGQTFSSSNSIGSAYIYHIAVDPHDRNTVLITADKKVHRSMDGGAAFVPVLEGINAAGETYDMNVVVCDPSTPGHLFAGGGNFYYPKVNGDLWESFDGGNAWQRTALTNRVINDVVINPDDPMILYAGCGYSDAWEAEILLKSTDGGKSWTSAEEGLPNTRYKIEDLWGVSPDIFFAVGNPATILRVDNTDIIKMDIGSIDAGFGQPTFYGVHGLSENNIFVVGESGTILHYDGISWSKMNSGCIENLHGVWGDTADNFYAVGDGGTILHYDGSAWSIMDSGVSNNLWGIFGISSNSLFAVGSQGMILRYDGSAWAPMASPTSNRMEQVWGLSSNDVFAAGDSGTLLHYDGRSWVQMDSKTKNDLYNLWGSAPDNIYAVGSGGTVLHYNGTDWEGLNFPTDEPLEGVYGFSPNNFLVAGVRSGIYAHNNGIWTTRRTAGVLGRAVIDVDFGFQNTTVLYAATFEGGVYASPNAGGSWLNLGAPRHSVFAIAPGSLYAGTQGGLVQCTGTGVIAGYLNDMPTNTGLDGATVYTDLGIKCHAIAGEYMMVSPSGTFSVTAVCDDRANSVRHDVTVRGGDVTFVDMAMESGLPDPDQPAVSSSSSGGGGGGCFIATAEDALTTRGESLPIFFILPVVLIFIAGLIVEKRLNIKMRAPLLLIVFCLLFACITPSFLSAATLFQQVGISSSPNPAGSGARAMGMGGAFIGVADDATAASWNPAGLIQLEKPEISLVGEFFYLREEFSSGSRPEIGNTSDEEDLNINFFSVATPFHLIKSMVVSINYQRLYDFNRSFSHGLNFSGSGLDLVQQKHFSQEGYVGAFGLAGAIEITPKLSVGGTLNIWTPDLFWRNGWQERYRETAVGTLSGVPVVTETDLRDEYRKFRGINFNFGFLWNITQYLTLGGVVKTPFTATLRHEFEFKHTQTSGAPVDTTVTSGQMIRENVDLRMPLSYGAGVSWRVSDALSLDLDVYRTQWGDYMLEDGRGNKFSPVDGRPNGLSSVAETTQLRVGGEYLMIRKETGVVVPLRAGLFYDPSPSEGSPEDMFGISIGSGISYKNYVLDAAYQLRWGTGVDSGNLITTSEADMFRHRFLVSIIFHF